ncbi:hypothetical protein BJX99DRAFT_181550 [Aspergillus californicus]
MYNYCVLHVFIVILSLQVVSLSILSISTSFHSQYKSLPTTSISSPFPRSHSLHPMLDPIQNTPSIARCKKEKKRKITKEIPLRRVLADNLPQFSCVDK